jgi:hypothetical protein
MLCSQPGSALNEAEVDRYIANAQALALQPRPGRAVILQSARHREAVQEK